MSRVPLAAILLERTESINSVSLFDMCVQKAKEAAELGHCEVEVVIKSNRFIVHAMKKLEAEKIVVDRTYSGGNHVLLLSWVLGAG